MIHIDNSGNILCKGDNIFGVLGLGQIDKSNHYTKAFLYRHHNVQFTMVNSSGLHSVAKDGAGNLWSTGNNECGQLGLGDNRNRSSFTRVEVEDDNRPVKFVSVHCGMETTLAIDCHGNLWGCGENTCGELGLGHRCNVNVFHKIPIEHNPKFTSVNTSLNCTVALDNDGNVWATGENKYGLLGLGHYNDVSFFTKVDLPVKVSVFTCSGAMKNILLDINGNIWICGCHEKKRLESYVKLNLIDKHDFTGSKKILDYGKIMVLDQHNQLWTITDNVVNKFECDLLGIVDVALNEGLLMIQCDDGNVYSETTSNLVKGSYPFFNENIKCTNLVNCDFDKKKFKMALNGYISQIFNTWGF